MNFYYADRDNKPVGPFSSEQLSDLVAKGVITADTLVVAEGEASWQSFSARFPAPRGAPTLPPIPSAMTAGPIKPEASQGIKRPLSPQAKNYRAAVQVTSNAFDDVERYNLPELTFGQLLSDQRGSIFLRFGRSKTKPSVVGDVQLYIHVRYHTGFSSLIHYNTAHVEGGHELELTHINSDHDENLWAEHFGLDVPDSLLWSRIDKGLRLRVSRPDEGKELILEIPPAYIEAVLALRFPSRFDLDAAAPTSQPSEPNRPDSWTTQLLVKLGSPLGLAYLMVLVAVCVIPLLPSWFFLPRKASEQNIPNGKPSATAAENSYGDGTSKFVEARKKVLQRPGAPTLLVDGKTRISILGTLSPVREGFPLLHPKVGMNIEGVGDLKCNQPFVEEILLVLRPDQQDPVYDGNAVEVSGVLDCPSGGLLMGDASVQYLGQALRGASTTNSSTLQASTQSVPQLSETKEIKARFGTITVVDDGGNKLMIDGNAFKDGKGKPIEADFIRLVKYFELPDQDVIVLYSNCNGTACAETGRYQFLTLSNSDRPKHSADFGDGRDNAIIQKENGKIVISFGENGTAVLDGEKTKIAKALLH